MHLGQTRKHSFSAAPARCAPHPLTRALPGTPHRPAQVHRAVGRAPPLLEDCAASCDTPPGEAALCKCRQRNAAARAAAAALPMQAPSAPGANATGGGALNMTGLVACSGVLYRAEDAVAFASTPCVVLGDDAKDFFTAVSLSVFFGFTGIDRFYLGCVIAPLRNARMCMRARVCVCVCACI